MIGQVACAGDVCFEVMCQSMNDVCVVIDWSSIDRYINNSLHLVRKYVGIFLCGHYLFREENIFPRAKLEENCELRGTDNVQGQISKHIFAPNRDYRVYYPSNLLRNARSFENWEINSRISPSFSWGIFGHVTYLDQSRVSKKIWWIITIDTN